MRISHATVVIGAACMLILQACKKDEYVYPSVVTEFVDAKTDADGTLTQLITDKGEVMDIQYREGLGGLAGDTVYRTVSMFRTLESGEAFIYSAQLILSQLPETADFFKEGIKTDPTDIRSIWQSGNYLNMILTPLVKDQDHTFRFIEYGIEEKDGGKTLRLGLYHDRHGDGEAFTREVYLSVPLWKYKGSLCQGDSIFFHIHTYKEGETIRKFTFPEIN